ncbi:MAG: hypothetical protein NZ870_03690 [bacterium]|nr:hypothetical protein [bacterium]
MMFIFIVFLTSKLGLNTYFGEVYIENIACGVKNSFKTITGKCFSVVNSGDSPIDILITVEKPDISECVAGFEPIPDVSFLKVRKSFFSSVMPNNEAMTDLIIYVPSGFEGRSFQAFIWSRSIGRTGFSIGAGLRSRVLIRTISAKTTMQNIDFEFLPEVLTTLRKSKKAIFKLKNYSKNYNRFELSLADGITEHNEIIGSSQWINFNNQIIVNKGKTKSVKLNFEIPEFIKEDVVYFIEAKPFGEACGVVNKVIIKGGTR